MMQVNFLAIIVCAVVSMIVGTIWYGPLFGKKWMKHFNFTKEDIPHTGKYLVDVKDGPLRFGGIPIKGFDRSVRP